jgi:hypothetical protein
MESQVSETLIIADKVYKLSVNLLPNYLKSHQLQMDDEKNYTAVWEIKDNKLYLNEFNAHINGKQLNMNDLLIDWYYPSFKRKD